jgi:hypothetical protein
MEQEYLGGFVRDGGFAIKFAVPLDHNLSTDICNGLATVADRLGYQVVRISAVDTRIQLVDEIFFRTAEQISWPLLSRKVIARLAAEAGYAWAGEPANVPLYQQLADENNVEAQMLLLDLKKQIGNRVFKEQKLSKDFRVAMTHLCIAELSGGPDGATTINVLTEWLTGRNKTVSAVKPYQIFRKINRATARYFFESMVQWVRLAGCAGVLILVDAARLMVAKNPQDQTLYYTKAAVLDTYEVLRQFIDGADRLNGCLMVVVPDTRFLEDLSRGISAYEALKFRVFDEIRDAKLVNPMASLVRLARSAQGR